MGKAKVEPKISVKERKQVEQDEMEATKREAARKAADAAKPAAPEVKPEPKPAPKPEPASNLPFQTQQVLAQQKEKK